MDDEIDIPQYFLCPISLQIMKDPVTTITGITYDRESIEQWLSTATAMCPVTKQALSKGSDLTPNHMLRRLIQAWCIANSKSGIDLIPIPKYPLNRSIVLKLVRDVNNTSNISLNVKALKKLDELATESDTNQKHMYEAGVPKAMIHHILRCVRESKDTGLEEALRILQRTWSPTPEIKNILQDNQEFVESLMWVLKNIENTAKTKAIIILKHVLELASQSLIENLPPHFFKQLVGVLRKDNKSITPQGIRSALRILIEACPVGRNKMSIIEAGAVFELIELELTNPEKKTSEMVFCLLAQLCSCADGRQQLLRHAGGIAVLAKRLLRISPATDDRALCIMESIARFAATREVVMEMLRVGGVSKLCMVLQADCAAYLKMKAREILRKHNNAWRNSPCIQVYLFTMHPAR